MAENNEYHIYIHTDEASDKIKAMAGTDSGSTNSKTADTTSAESTLYKAMSGVVSYATVASLADNLVSYQISQVSLETGATEYEQRLATKYSIAKQIGGAGVALIGGALTGGPVGLAVAAIGVAAAGISKLIHIEQKKETLAKQQALEDISINMNRIRAGVGGRRNANQ